MATDPTAEKHELLSKSELSIWLDVYDDVFSDFDSRPFAERALSDDFISEVKKMAREKLSGKIQLKLLMPEKLRDQKTEAVIIKSLHGHFNHFANQMGKEMHKTRSKGYVFAIIGFLVMSLSAVIISLQEKKLYYNILRVILEPSGWFLVWNGLDNIFYAPQRKQPDLNFNRKMAHAEITFVSF